MIVNLIVFLFLMPLPIGILSVNDIVCLLASLIAIASLLNFKPSYYSYLFCNSYIFNVVIVSALSLLVISFVHFCSAFGLESAANNIIRFIRGSSFALYLLGTLFIARLIFPYSLRLGQCNSGKILVLVYSLISLSAISLVYSLISSCPAAVYGSSVCIAGVTSYSANGYIAVFSFYTLLMSSVLYSHLNQSNHVAKKPRLLRFLLPFSYLTYVVIAVNSGSRGAIMSLSSGLLSIGLFYAYRSILSLKIRLTMRGIFSISILFLVVAFLVGAGYRSLRLFYSLLYDNSAIASSLYSQRYDRIGMLEKANIFIGDGNFSLSRFSTGPSFFDGSLQYFYISFGIIGLLILFAFLYSAISTMRLCSKKLLITSQPKSDFLIYALPFASILSALVGSFPNELGSLNSIAPFYFLVFLLSGYMIKIDL